MRAVAVCLVAAAVACAMPSGTFRSATAAVRAAHGSRADGRRGAAGPAPLPRLPGRPGPAVVVWLVATTSVLLALMDGVRLMLALVTLGAAGGTLLLLRRGHERRSAETRRTLAVELCEGLVGELRAGQPVLASLEHCRDLWPEIEPVVAAGRLGADVPGALRRVSSLPGAEGLADVASAWRVSMSSGAGLAVVLSQVALTAREQQATRRVVQGELASAQATARLVAVLPLVFLAMSGGLGGDPWHFLLDTAPGVTCLGAAAVSTFGGLLWIDRIAATVQRD